MRRMILLLAMVLLTAILFASGIATVAAEPMKNQIEVPARCGKDGKYTFVLNGEGNVGHIEGSTSNIIVQRYTVTYLDPETREPVAPPETFDQGNKEGLEGDLITCHGETTVELFGLGRVTAVFEFQAFVTPSGDS
jgi:hypothetical protein